MRNCLLAGLTFIMCAGLCSAAVDDKHDHSAPAKSNPVFDQLKGLAGTWEGTAGEEKNPVTVTYRVTSGGSAVIETLFLDTPHEMVTVYHLDGENVVLTHYCSAQNQPRMKLAKSDGKTANFEFTGATNLKSDKDFHMHSAKIEFVDKDTLKAEWTGFADGQAAHVAKFELKRKKS